MDRAMTHAMDRIARASVVAAAAAIGLATEPVTAGAGDGTVVRGDVTFSREGNLTIIRASDGSIISHANFDIPGQETVQFIQPGAAARVLNRITGAEPTRIDGTLLANGQVYIVNPAGVVFSSGAVVDVAGIYAAAGTISNEDFLGGVDAFGNLSGAVVNHGHIRAGAAHLIGRHVANHGAIVAEGGVVTMVAGGDVLLRRHGEKITVRIDGAELSADAGPAAGASAPDLGAPAGVANTGTVKATAGQVILGAGDLYSLAVHNTGRVESGSGGIQVTALDGVVHNEGDLTTSVTSGEAGTVVVSAPSIVNAGTVTADADDGRAGSVRVEAARHTYLLDGSVVSAAGGAGAAAGGEAIVDTPTGLTIHATGARVDVSGGAAGGDGGFAEVSGADLMLNGRIDAGAGAGFEAGKVLIDPGTIAINDEGTDDGFLTDGTIDFDVPDTTTDLVISDEAIEAITGDITLQATENIHVNEQLDLVHDNDLTLEALGSITINAPILGVDDLTLLADTNMDGFGTLFLSAPLDDIGGSALLRGAIILHNGGSMTTAGTQTYLSPVDLCVDTTLHAESTTFFDTVDATNAGLQSLTATGPVAFQGRVGGTRELRSLTVNGPTTVGTDLVRTADFQHYLGGVDLEASTETRSLDAGEIRFGGPVEGEHDLLVTTGGTTRFDDTVGAGLALGALTTDAAGTTRLAGEVDARTATFGDPVTLDADVTVHAETATFASSITGNDHDLTVNADHTRFLDDATGFDELRTDAAGVTFVAGDLTARQVVLEDVMVLLEDVGVAADELIVFGMTVDGAFDLVALSGRHLVFGGEVGGDVRLASLVAGAREFILIEGGRVLTDGDIRFNPLGFSNVPEAASIGADIDSLLLRSEIGDVLMGINDKLTVLGDLGIEAPLGTVRIGDVNTLGDLEIEAMRIEILTRPGGLVQSYLRSFTADGGVDVIAGGTIGFSSVPVILGTRAYPVFATPDGKGVSDRLDGFAVVAYGDIDRPIFFADERVLDLVASPFRGDGLAEAIPRDEPPIKDRVFREPFALRAMERLAIFIRTIDDDELRTIVEGRQLIDDSAHDAGATRLATSTGRLRRESVLDVLDRFSALFLTAAPGTTATTTTTPTTPPRDQVTHIRAILTEAWAGYETRPDATDTDPRFVRTFLGADERYAEALAYLDALAALFREIANMGVTSRELDASIEAVLGPITPDAMETDDLAIAVGAVEGG